MIVGVDFDGTVVEHCYPQIGPESPDASRWLQQLVKLGCKIVLWTMRDTDELESACRWFKERNIPLFGVNENPDQKSWTASPKAYCHVYVDDCGIMIPSLPGQKSKRPVVDWSKVGPALVVLAEKYNKHGRLV